ncbi:conserved hypothetical protein [Culex quinquefasciatus]|uniref:Uncharacterized protein n=1 Tax=Culex quinquefasciatus TaxID=7176 RepID=B0X0F4_CULQU|nr:conserved hypothetical protein [Culex quinquefasciatus]|eukprot:XP_001863126.1 conserved hypothetical protein [Culex quinquefasciatus]
MDSLAELSCESMSIMAAPNVVSSGNKRKQNSSTQPELATLSREERRRRRRATLKYRTAHATNGPGGIFRDEIGLTTPSIGWGSKTNRSRTWNPNKPHDALNTIPAELVKRYDIQFKAPSVSQAFRPGSEEGAAVSAGWSIDARTARNINICLIRDLGDSCRCQSFVRPLQLTAHRLAEHPTASRFACPFDFCLLILDNPDRMSLIRGYNALCKRKVPVIPPELSDCQRFGGPPSVGNIQGLAEPNRIFPLTRELVGASETVKISDVKKRCTTKLGQEDACIEDPSVQGEYSIEPGTNVRRVDGPPRRQVDDLNPTIIDEFLPVGLLQRDRPVPSLGRADVFVVGQKHGQLIDSHALAAGRWKTVPLGVAEVLILQLSLVIAGCCVGSLLLESLALDGRIV